MAFTSLPADNLRLEIPEYVYSVTTPTEFEVCTEKGIKRSALVRLRSWMQGSPQGPGSLWVITSYRPDIDRVIVEPTGSKAGCFAKRTITLAYLKQNFDRLDNFKQKSCAANAQD